MNHSNRPVRASSGQNRWYAVVASTRVAVASSVCSGLSSGNSYPCSTAHTWRPSLAFMRICIPRMRWVSLSSLIVCNVQIIYFQYRIFLEQLHTQTFLNYAAFSQIDLIQADCRNKRVIKTQKITFMRLITPSRKV